MLALKAFGCLARNELTDKINLHETVSRQMQINLLL